MFVTADLAEAHHLGQRWPLAILADDRWPVEFLDVCAHRDRAMALGGRIG